MRRTTVWGAILAVAAAPLFAQDAGTTSFPDESPPADARSWTRELKGRANRGELLDAAEKVRGDSGKWNDEASLAAIAGLQKKPSKASLDDWCEQQLKAKAPLTGGDNIWIVFRSSQLDDNDRLWIERVERRGNRVAIVACKASWRGKYFRNFTYYNVGAVNLGKLEPGRYEATWTTKPFIFNKFDRPGPSANAWPDDEHPAEDEASTLSLTFEVKTTTP